MGEYITYVFLQSLNPNDWIFSKGKEKWEKGMNNIQKKDREEVIRLWVKSAIILCIS